jgi:acetate---CoA ligase (ADP-forming) subunit beta
MSARSTTSRMLPEPEAALLLTSHGLPYVDHGTADTAEAAVTISRRLGYPVVLKIVSAEIVHKTEAGGVVLGLRTDREVLDAYDGLVEHVRASCPGAPVDGVLVARQVRARRELIVGAIRDATFGPTVMVGLGGVFAEALRDVVFRLAPLRRGDGLDMLDELRGTRLLDGFRGEPPVDRDQVAEMLVGVGDLLLSHPEIEEIDLNPVSVAADGCVALDARIMVKD